MLIGIVPCRETVQAASGGAIITDSADFDVFLNVDPSYNVDANVLADKVGGYLDQLIQAGGGDKNYRINTASTQIDPTDLTKWHVYDHYDKLWYGNEEKWLANYTGRGNNDIPETWYYGSVSETYTETNGSNEKRTIEELLNGTGTFGKAAKLREHIYTFAEDKKPAMQFYGYSVIGFSDFLFYPATTTSEKTVKYDVDASNVEPHSLKYAGFLVNAGTSGEGSAKTMDGYLLAISYLPLNASAGTKANGISSIDLYKLDGVNVETLRAKGLKQGQTDELLPGASLVETSFNKPFYSKSHLEMSVTSTNLKVSIQELDSSDALTGNAVLLFDTPLDDTGFGGFGPYVDYAADANHSCDTVSSYRFSNMEMSFKELMAGTSPLEAYQYADYLENSQNRFFINLTNKDELNYKGYGEENDLDKAYTKQIQDNQVVLITDEGTADKSSIFPEKYLNQNTKSVNADTDVNDSNIADLGAGNDETEKLAAKLAWLIYNTQFDGDNSGIPSAPINAVVADVKLMTGTSQDDVQINSICREYMEDTLKVYPNAEGSTNVTAAETPHYKLTKPDKTTADLVLDGDGAFTMDRNSDQWPMGEYKVTLDYTSTDPDKMIVPSVTRFTLVSDPTAPAAEITVNGTSAKFVATNVESTGDYTYTSPLDGYAVAVNQSIGRPEAPADFTAFTNPGNTPEVDISSLLGNLKAGRQYIHVFVKDKAGNLGYETQGIDITGPSIYFTDSTDEVTQDHPYTGDMIHVNTSQGSYGIAMVEMSTDGGVTWNTLDSSKAPSYDCSLPIGGYNLQVRATDTAGNVTSTLTLPVYNKKVQTLEGENNYVLEVGIDTAVKFEYKVSGDTSGEGESLGAISYEITSNPGDMITLNGDTATINKTGTATVTVKAQETGSHQEISTPITIRVVDPLSVKLNAQENTDKKGITVHPTFSPGVYDIANCELKIRVKTEEGTEAWSTIENWSWNNDYTIPYESLEDYVEYEVLLSATDSRPETPRTVTQTFSFTTPDEHTHIMVSDVNDGIKGYKYTDTIDATGTGPMTWELKGGALPDGLALDPDTGEITGTPTKAGIFTFDVSVTNAAGDAEVKSFTISIKAPPEIITEDLPDAVRGDTYSESIEATGDGELTWKQDGKLPEDLSLYIEKGTLKGILKGTLTKPGTYTFMITVENDYGKDSKLYTIFVADPPIITSTRIPDAVNGSEYSYTMESTGDKEITWSVSKGSLPEGLQLDENSGEIKGTPVKSGTYKFAVTAENSVGKDTKSYEVYVATPPQITKQPKNQSVTEKKTVKLTADAEGDEPLFFQWQVNRGKGWEDIDNATEKDYSFVSSLSDDGSRYRCVVTNDAGQVYSDEVTVKVKKEETTKPKSGSGSSNTNTQNGKGTSSAEGAKTGDTNNIILWIGIMFLALLSFGIVHFRKRPSKK